MKNVLILALLVVSGCGYIRDELKGAKGEKGDTGAPGEPGKSIIGGKGSDGSSCSVSSTGRVECTDGSSYQIPQPVAGHDGQVGEVGASGSSCSVSSTIFGASIVCDNGTTATVLNGLPGAAGSQVTPVPFCPNIAGSFPETGICVDGSLYAVYDSGVAGAVHYTKLTPLTYRTTDGRNCSFTVVSGCSIQ